MRKLFEIAERYDADPQDAGMYMALSKDQGDGGAELRPFDGGRARHPIIEVCCKHALFVVVIPAQAGIQGC